ncbi:16S rRNA (cytidine(1402)-2'-O)-methyltransferase [Hazenella sp. IB182357]|uniref:Ribosomal RNA small subunit methyltransferase I n=1 Tax=Polycladospora coralii TaxID=2771432 RepID=A0A926RUE9_9BACL|nr:16S rRNA (cytidine(1402)-2'-O)-methyltransferase [Polycladospora coralii]MBD1372482.1 16S rRNA (cytidine(1402)-2'-O)-methyltransferase [Polycladospora coralii]MBS7531804.1 16S rRNA (cytidine(1402)-2'-O)-methyltransferase [Polycladospora coralii]
MDTQLQNEGVLYVVGTPIGNLGDMSTRAIEILMEVDYIAAEDTRHTQKLLNHFSINTPMTSYHEHNEQTKGQQLLQKLQMGQSIALVSDAGLPGISDPGEVLVRLATEHAITVLTIPGPNAAVTALVSSGLPTQPFLFVGFLPRHKKDRKIELQNWKLSPATLIFYEAPHRIVAMLSDLCEVVGNRRVAISRELTKVHETWVRGRLDDCLHTIKENGVRGEYTIVVEGASKEEIAANSGERSTWWESLSLIQHVDTYIAQGNDKKSAIQAAAKDRAIPKREVYNHYHQS